MALTTQQKLDDASISEYLSNVDIQKKGLNGGGIPLDLPEKIYILRKSIAYWYALDPTDTTLIATSNYLLALCGLYGLEAQNILLNPGTTGGVIARNTPLPYQFLVSASSFMPTGDSTVTITAFIGFNLLFVRGAITQSTVNLGDGSSYYTWSKITGVFTCSPAAYVDELFQLFPV